MSMKSFLKRATGFDYAVYWPPITGPVDNYGQYLPDSAIEVKCRWEDSTVDFVDREGKVSVSKSKVFLTVPMAFGGILWHGRYVDLVDATNPMNNPGALEIRQIMSTPSFNNTATLVTVYL